MTTFEKVQPQRKNECYTLRFAEKCALYGYWVYASTTWIKWHRALTNPYIIVHKYTTIRTIRKRMKRNEWSRRDSNHFKSHIHHCEVHTVLCLNIVNSMLSLSLSNFSFPLCLCLILFPLFTVLKSMHASVRFKWMGRRVRHVCTHHAASSSFAFFSFCCPGCSLEITFCFAIHVILVIHLCTYTNIDINIDSNAHVIHFTFVLSTDKTFATYSSSFFFSISKQMIKLVCVKPKWDKVTCCNKMNWHEWISTFTLFCVRE